MTLLEIARYKDVSIQSVVKLIQIKYGRDVPCIYNLDIPDSIAKAIAPGLFEKPIEIKTPTKKTDKKSRAKEQPKLKPSTVIIPIYNSDNDKIATFKSFRNGLVVLDCIGGGQITLPLNNSIDERELHLKRIIEYGVTNLKSGGHGYYIKRCVIVSSWQKEKLKEVLNFKIVKGVVLDALKDYFLINVFGVKAYLYKNQIPEKVKLSYGKVVEVIITKIDIKPDKMFVWASMTAAIFQKEKKWAREQDELKRQNEFRMLKEGRVVDAVIEKVEDNYILVKFGSLLGSISREQLYHTRVRRIDLYLFEGKKIKAKVLSKEEENGKYKIKLSYKACLPNNWDELDIFEGDLVEEAMYAGISDRGVFLSIAEGLEGFLPIGDISRRELGYFKDWDYSSDQTVEVWIKEFNRSERRLYLTRMPIYDDLWEEIEENFKIKHSYPAIILDMDEDNVWAELKENLDVMIPKKELNWQNTGYDEQRYDIGQQINVYLTKIDTYNRRIYGSVRQLTPNPWEIASSVIANGSILEVKLVEMNDKFLYVETNDSNRLHGKIRLSELSWSTQDDSTKTKLPKIGEKIKAKIVTWKPEKFCMELSVRQLEEDPWKSVIVGAEVKGTITKKMVDDYLIIELPNGLKCLSNERTLSGHVGEAMPFKVIESNRYKNRIVVSNQRLKQDAALDEVIRNFFS